MLNKKSVEQVRLLYLFASAFWLLLISTICYDSIWDIVILFLPFVFFAINYHFVSRVEDNIENRIRNSTIIGTSLLIALPILMWTRTACKASRKRFFFRLIALALIFALLSVVDVWVPETQLVLFTRLKSIFETFSAGLFMYGVFRFFVEGCETEEQCNTGIIK